MIKKLTALTVLAALAAPALAQTDIKANSPYSAYVQDGRGVVARSGSALCWRTGYWTPADALAGCDAPLVVAQAPATPQEPAAKPAEPAVAPPAPTPAPPKRCDFAVTLQNDETFDFNKATLKASAKQHIDTEVMSKLGNCAKVDLIVVTGHTDMIGTHPYNQKLSEKRADAVAAYIASKGITATIDTMGMGKTQQIKSCDDKLPQAKLAECLAPNRRVVIEGRGMAK